MLDVCDRLGMLVWNEFSDVWDIQKVPRTTTVNFPDWWQRDLTSMVLRDRNHPSVIIWSIGNEISADPNNYGPQLAALVRSLDTTQTGLAGRYEPLGPAGSDPWQYTDVGDLHGADPVAAHAAHPGKAITQSEDTAAECSMTTGSWLHDNPWLVGAWVWVGWDYIGEAGLRPDRGRRQRGGRPRLASAPSPGRSSTPGSATIQGDIDMIGQRKPQNYWRAVVNGFSALELLVERPTPPGTQQFAVWYTYYDELPSWTWDVPKGQLMTVHAYSSGDSVTLLLNGTPVATKTLAEADKRVATFSVPYARGELTAIASQNGREIARKRLATAGAAAALRLTPDVDRSPPARTIWRTCSSKSSTATDDPCPMPSSRSPSRSAAPARSSLPATATPTILDSFQRPRHWSWHGQTLAVLRPAKTPGRLSLIATAPGLTPATLTLPVSSAHGSRYHQALGRRPRVAASFAAPGLMFGLGAAVLKRRMQNAEPTATDALDGTEE